MRRKFNLIKKKIKINLRKISSLFYLRKLKYILRTHLYRKLYHETIWSYFTSKIKALFYMKLTLRKKRS